MMHLSAGGAGCTAFAPVGVDDVIEDIKLRLREHGKLLIWGIGGIGKSTLAQATFDPASSWFWTKMCQRGHGNR